MNRTVAPLHGTVGSVRRVNGTIIETLVGIIEIFWGGLTSAGAGSVAESPKK